MSTTSPTVLSNTVLLYPPPHPPSNSPSTTSPAPPTTIILSFGPSASPSTHTPYITNYRLLYPTSTILVLQQPFSDSLLKTHGQLSAALLPAVNLLAETRPVGSPLTTDAAAASEKLDGHAADAADGQQRLLLHVFGNAGGVAACALARLWRGRTGMPLPVRGVVLDVEPNCCSSAGDDLVAWVVSMLLAMVLLIASVFGKGDESGVVGDLNDARLFEEKARRLYVQGEKGKMFVWFDERAVDGNKEAERREWDVRRHKVDATGKSIVGSDRENFWGGIEEFWGAKTVSS